MTWKGAAPARRADVMVAAAALRELASMIVGRSHSEANIRREEELHELARRLEATVPVAGDREGGMRGAAYAALVSALIEAGPVAAIAYKYADPDEDARYIFDEDDLAAIRRDDPSLIVAWRPLS